MYVSEKKSMLIAMKSVQKNLLFCLIDKETTNTAYKNNNEIIEAFEQSEYKSKDSILNCVKSVIGKLINES